MKKKNTVKRMRDAAEKNTTQRVWDIERQMPTAYAKRMKRAQQHPATVMECMEMFVGELFLKPLPEGDADTPQTFTFKAEESDWPEGGRVGTRIMDDEDKEIIRGAVRNKLNELNSHGKRIEWRVEDEAGISLKEMLEKLEPIEVARGYETEDGRMFLVDCGGQRAGRYERIRQMLEAAGKKVIVVCSDSKIMREVEAAFPGSDATDAIKMAQLNEHGRKLIKVQEERLLGDTFDTMEIKAFLRSNKADDEFYTALRTMYGAEVIDAILQSLQREMDGAPYTICEGCRAERNGVHGRIPHTCAEAEMNYGKAALMQRPFDVSEAEWNCKACIAGAHHFPHTCGKGGGND